MKRCFPNKEVLLSCITLVMCASYFIDVKMINDVISRSIVSKCISKVRNTNDHV